MAEVLPMRMEQEIKAHMGMPQYWAPAPDERDAYIGWLKSEFAAANALIDSMCQHMQSIGGPGEYEPVLRCLNRRRHAWTPSLYMQRFFSIAEVVSALQEVGWKRHQSRIISSSTASVAFPSSQAQDTAQLLGNDQRSNIDSSVVKSQQSGQVRIECLSTSNKDVNGLHVNATTETGEGHSASSALSTSAESCIIDCNKKTSHTGYKAHICNSAEQVISANNTKGHTNDQTSLDVKLLLSTEILIASMEEHTRHAIIKRSMQFQCCEHVDGQQTNDGESVELCEHVFDNKELDEIIEIIGQLQVAGRQGELGCAFIGCKKSRCLPDIIQFGPKIDDSPCIPKFLQAIIRWLTSCGILLPNKSPDSCLISIFDEASFEAPNTDQGAWEKPLCVISLMEDCSMVFGHSITTDQYGSCKGPFQVALPAGSVLLLRENFTGILQKAIPASPSRRITIALGKAVRTSSAELNCVNAAGKIKNKYQGIGGDKQGRLLPNYMGVQTHMQFPFPCMQPNVPGLVLPPVIPRLLRSGSTSAAGTGVFFPSCDASVSVPTSWLLLSSTSSTSVQYSKRGVKHAVKGASHLTDAKAPKKKLGGKVAPCPLVDTTSSNAGIKQQKLPKRP